MHATVRLAPAFSMGGKAKADLSSSKKSPGPAAYTLPTTVNANGSNIVIGCKFKDIAGDDTPAPTNYNTIGSWNNTQSKMPHFSFGRRFKMPGGDKTPGSGAYTPEVRNVLRKSASYTMRSKLKAMKGSGNPGPANYDIHKTWDNVKQKSPAFSVSHRNKDVRRMSTPAPNAYKPRKSVKKAAAYTMRPRTGGYRKSNGPGPAAYNIGSQFGSRRR